MIDSLKTTISIKNAYDYNKFINWLEKLPFVGEYVPLSWYRLDVLKGLKLALGVIFRLIKNLFLTAAYVCGLMILPYYLMDKGKTVDITTFVVHVFLLLSIIGFLSSTQIIRTSMDRYYSIVLLRMDARKCAISEFVFMMFEKFIAFFLILPLISLIFNVSILKLFLVMLMAVLGKPLGALNDLHTQSSKHVNLTLNIKSIFIIVGIALAYASAVLDIYIKGPMLYGICVAFILTGIISSRYVYRFKNYTYLYKDALSPSKFYEINIKMGKDAKVKYNRNGQLIYKGNVTSNKSGYAFFHDIFVKRHRGLLAKRISIISGVLILIIGIIFIMYVIKQFGNGLKVSGLSSIVMSLPFGMYALNIGDNFNETMFVNCDRAMLNYNYYKKPKTILMIFYYRLKTLSLINIISALLLSVVFMELFIFSGIDDLRCYIAVPMAIIALSLFFSVHRLVIYYLLQPYDNDASLKDPRYKIINAVTYAVCYFLFIAKIPLDYFKVAIVYVVFAVVYILIALVLVYYLAPKKFRIHK